jgi:multiple sugar transport system substrate-binding protein
MLEDFEKQNDGIKVDLMHIPQNYFQKIHLLFASNTAPDVIFINNLYLPLYANAGVLEDLTGYEEFEYDKYFPKSVEAMKFKGKIYALPRDVSNLVFFYNKDLFKKLGVSYLASNCTLDDLLNKAQKLTTSDTFGISFEEKPLYYLPYMLYYGGWGVNDTVNYFKENILDKPENKKGLEFYADLRRKYHVAPKKEEIGSATMAQMFLQGKVGMYLSGRWMVPKFRQEAKFDWDVVEFPKTMFMDSSGWAVSRTSKHKSEAVKLIKFLSSENNSKKFAQSGLIVPARVDSAYSESFLDGKKPHNAQAFLNTAKNSVPTPVTVNYNEILDDLNSKTEYVFNK